jgi:hypothetical protein
MLTTRSARSNRSRNLIFPTRDTAKENTQTGGTTSSRRRATIATWPRRGGGGGAARAWPAPMGVLDRHVRVPVLLLGERGGGGSSGGRGQRGRAGGRRRCPPEDDAGRPHHCRCVLCGWDRRGRKKIEIYSTWQVDPTFWCHVNTQLARHVNVGFGSFGPVNNRS